MLFAPYMKGGPPEMLYFTNDQVKNLLWCFVRSKVDFWDERFDGNVEGCSKNEKLTKTTKKKFVEETKINFDQDVKLAYNVCHI